MNNEKMLPFRCHRGHQTLENPVIPGFFWPLKLFPLGRNTPQADPQGRRAGAYQVPRPETYIRDLGTAKRCGCENRQQHARALRRGLHPPHLHPRHTADAAKGRGENGQLHGTSDVSRKRTQKYRREGKISSPILFKPIRAFLKCSPSQGHFHLTHSGSIPAGYSPVVM